MTDEIVIRAAIESDSEGLARLCALVQELHFRERPDVFKEPDLAGLEQWFRNTLSSSAAAETWIAQRGEVPTGFVVVTHQDRDESVFCYQRRWHEVDMIAVDPKHRQRGIARKLLQHVVRVATEREILNVELSTWEFNQIARKSFEQIGFARRYIRYERRP